MTNHRKKARTERETELHRLWTQPGGRAEVIELFLQATGSQTGTIPPCPVVRSSCLQVGKAELPHKTLHKNRWSITAGIPLGERWTFVGKNPGLRPDAQIRLTIP
jgi:hypothetical protein